MRESHQPPAHRPSKLIPLPSDAAAVLFTSNLVGFTFARSLHYQFFSWIGFQLPFLLWLMGPLNTTA